MCKTIIVAGAFFVIAAGAQAQLLGGGNSGGFSVLRDPMSGDTLVRGNQPGTEYRVRKDPVFNGNIQIIGPMPGQTINCFPNAFGGRDCR